MWVEWVLADGRGPLFFLLGSRGGMLGWDFFAVLCLVGVFFGGEVLVIGMYVHEMVGYGERGDGGLSRHRSLSDRYLLAQWWESKALRIHLSSFICYVFGGVDFRGLVGGGGWWWGNCSVGLAEMPLLIPRPNSIYSIR